ncbi:hypothetical protein GALMADRAFT_249146 [Galerina marginata CBS 339.88]|uniref:Uncharacterized protein n=1 Tax=Galerina marginata (strain CBS 339.88) TaxID=685588 RepID=A0A067T861_GALM3|nr:hypothetical protein GALMADRAFT_249146 [Galerina marginata CBS 339.88]
MAYLPLCKVWPSCFETSGIWCAPCEIEKTVYRVEIDTVHLFISLGLALPIMSGFLDDNGYKSTASVQLRTGDPELGPMTRDPMVSYSQSSGSRWILSRYSFFGTIHLRHPVMAYFGGFRRKISDHFKTPMILFANYPHNTALLRTFGFLQGIISQRSNPAGHRSHQDWSRRPQ